MTLLGKLLLFLRTFLLSPQKREAIKEQAEKSKLNMKNRYSHSAALARQAKDARKSKDSR